MKVSIAIPDSSLIDEQTYEGKTLKVFQIARACAIFHVDTIYIYHEAAGKEKDKMLLRTVLRFLETPQYLRRTVFRKIDELRFAGSLSPLKIPSHLQTSDPTRVKKGDVRDGVIVLFRGQKYIDVGFDQLIPYRGQEEVGRRITIQFKEGYPNFSIKQINKTDLKQYWGYDVKESINLHSLLSKWNSFIVFTSRKGKPLHKVHKYLEEISNSEVLLVFGSPKRGVHEILGKDLTNVQRSQILNFFPDQTTETVRLEEAILGVLAILNIMTHNQS